jgi:tripartite-type tricarboxylate transporter receptor subunit TctC
MFDKLLKLSPAALLVSVAVSANVQAQSVADYPSRPIEFMVGYAPGGSADTISRIVMPVLGKRLGQTVVLDNRAGAGGMIGLGAVAKGKPDGYTMGIGTGGALTANIHLMTNMPYHPTRDLMPVSMMVKFPIVIAVNSSSPINSVQDLVRAAKSGKKLNYGSAGMASSTHLAGELFNQMAKVNLLHVAYKGLGPASIDLISNQIELLFTDLLSAMPHVQGGRMKLIAVASAERSSLLPNVPTIAESGVPGYRFGTWMGIVMPAGTPKAIVTKVSTELGAVLKDPEMIKRIHAAGAEPIFTTPEAMADLMKEETESTGAIIRGANIKLSS